MRTIAVAAVSCAFTLIIVGMTGLATAGTRDAQTARQGPRNITVRPGDQIFAPGLDLHCWYFDDVRGYGRLMDCSRASTDGTGWHTFTSARLMQLRSGTGRGFHPPRCSARRDP